MIEHESAKATISSAPKWAADITIAQVVGTWLGEARDENELHGLGWFQHEPRIPDDPTVRTGSVTFDWDNHGTSEVLDGSELNARSFSLTFDVDLDACKCDVYAEWVWYAPNGSLHAMDDDTFSPSLFPLVWAWLHAVRNPT